MDKVPAKNANLILTPIPARTEEVAKIIIDAAYRVHTALGPGLLESVYEACITHELRNKGIIFESQVALPIVYAGETIAAGLRLDLLVEKRVIVEIKVVENILPVHKAQLLSYLKLANIRLGFLINFNVVHLRDGISRFIM